jgi:dipeptidyl aminopeptidase/acylaminoacyl peptidase
MKGRFIMIRKTSHIFLLMLLITLFTSLVGAQKRVLTYDEIIKIHRVYSPAVSPDGKMLAFSSRLYSFETDTFNEDVFVVPSEGGEIIPVASHKGKEFSPLWSPDGEKLTFISDRAGAPQIYMMYVNRMGEPVKITDIPNGVYSYKWSPTGNHIIFTTEIYQGCNDFECDKKRIEEESKNKVSARVTDHLLYRHWSYWKIGTVCHLFSLRLSDNKITDLTPGNKWVPFGPFDGPEQFTVSPDGLTVAYTKRTGDKPAEDTNNDIYTVPIDGGESEQITTSKASDSYPMYSPNGKYLSYLKMQRAGFESDKTELILINLENKGSVNLTNDYDGSVMEYVWSNDNKTIYFISESRARRGLYRVNLVDKKVERLFHSGKASCIQIDPNAKSLFYCWENSIRPNEIYRFDLGVNNPVQLTRVNEELMAGIEMNPVEDFDYRGAGSDMIHGLLIKPPFFDPMKKYPLILIIHGGPQIATLDEFHYRWNLQMFASRGYVVAGINFHGSSGYGQKFTDSISYDWGGQPFRDIMIGVDYLLAKYTFIDKNRLGAAGASYGGYMIDWILGQTDRFNVLVSHSGVFNLQSLYGATDELWFPEWEFRGTPWNNPSYYRKMSPSTYVKRFKTPTLVIHGQQDFRVPVEQSMELFTALQKMNVESRFIYFPDECHFILKPNNARFWYESVLDWMDKYLKK